MGYAAIVVSRVGRAGALAALLLVGCVDETVSAPEPAAVAEAPGPEAGSARREGVGIVFVSETGWRSGERAQAGHDAFATHLATLNRWPGAFAVLATDASEVAGHLADGDVHFGVLTAGAYQTLRSGLEMKVLAEVDFDGLGRFHIVSQLEDLAECFGKRLVTSHTAARTGLGRAAGGAFGLESFEMVWAARPNQVLRTLGRGEAACALLDDAQLARTLRQDADRRPNVLWTSAPAAPGVVVSFSATPAGESATFEYLRPKVCSGRGARLCGQAAIGELRPAGRDAPDGSRR